MITNSMFGKSSYYVCCGCTYRCIDHANAIQRGMWCPQQAVSARLDRPISVQIQFGVSQNFVSKHFCF